VHAGSHVTAQAFVHNLVPLATVEGGCPTPWRIASVMAVRPLIDTFAALPYASDTFVRSRLRDLCVHALQYDGPLVAVDCSRVTWIQSVSVFLDLLQQLGCVCLSVEVSSFIPRITLWPWHIRIQAMSQCALRG
jgi:hypothetical protein